MGVVLGVGMAVLVGRALEAYLFDVRSADPIALGAAALIFGAAALGACAVPALRAARTDLLAALHHE